MSRDMLRALGIIAAASFTATPVMSQSPPAAPPASGWVGITYSGTGETDRDGNLVYSYYPVVVTVDPGSPAARAGIAAGDTIVAFNDRDLRRYAFPIRNMIQPGKTFLIRARRGNTERVTKLIVVERPPDRQEHVELTMSPLLPGAPEPPFVLTPGPQRVRMSFPRTALIGASMPIAGAEVRTLSVDLAKTLGIKPQGLFIVNVVEGSPAKASGLRDGDVLLRAANASLFSPQDLRRVLESSLDKDVKLEILRQRKPQTVVLKW